MEFPAFGNNVPVVCDLVSSLVRERDLGTGSERRVFSGCDFAEPTLRKISHAVIRTLVGEQRKSAIVKGLFEAMLWLRKKPRGIGLFRIFLVEEIRGIVLFPVIE